MNQNDIDSVQVRLYGGLGNQLFQYFAGNYFSQFLNRSLEVDFNWIERGHSHSQSDIRDFLFYQQGNHAVSSKKSFLNYLVSDILTSLSARFDLVAGILNIDNTFDVVKHPNQLFSRKVKLRGYYQTPLYFHNLIFDGESHILDLIDRKFSVVQELNHEVIGIHVRGGDYLDKMSLYSKLDREYYTNAINWLKNIYPGHELIVFTDDKVYAESLIDRRFSYIFFDDRNMRASQVLQHMASCDALVTANSTFSYWAGLAGNVKTVISPKNWFNSRLLSVSFPEGWIII